MPKKIPTLIAILLLVALALIVSTVTNSVINSSTKASASIEPRNIEFTNISDTGFTVTWVTNDPATGTIELIRRSSKIIYDQRDTGGKLGKFTTHSIPVRDATPDTQYEIKLLSNGKTFLQNGKPYAVATAKQLDPSPSGLEPAYGSVVTAAASPAYGALVYLTLDGGQTLSTIVGQTGSWLIPLNTVRISDLTNRLKPQNRIDEQILVRSAGGEASAVTDSLNDSPVPSMTIGKSYDFRKQQAMQPTTSMGSLAVAISPKPEQSVLGETTNTQSKKIFPITITQPDDNASLISNMPLFSGTGVPGKNVALTIGIKHPITASVIVGTDSIWRYTQTKPLGVGRQSVTISTVDNYNKPVAITHSFDVLKSGTQVLGTATPSATLAPSPTEYLTPTFTPTPSSTLSGQNPPETGSVLPTILLIMVSVGFLIGGFSLAWIR